MVTTVNVCASARQTPIVAEGICKSINCTTSVLWSPETPPLPQWNKADPVVLSIPSERIVPINVHWWYYYLPCHQSRILTKVATRRGWVQIPTTLPQVQGTFACPVKPTWVLRHRRSITATPPHRSQKVRRRWLQISFPQALVSTINYPVLRCVFICKPSRAELSVRKQIGSIEWCPRSNNTAAWTKLFWIVTPIHTWTHKCAKLNLAQDFKLPNSFFETWVSQACQTNFLCVFFVLHIHNEPGASTRVVKWLAVPSLGGCRCAFPSR